MTQAFNLSQFANKLNTSGQADNTALQSGTYPINVSGTASSTFSLITTNFSIVESGGKLYFRYGSTNIVSLDSFGNFTTIGSHTAGGTP